MAKMSGEQKSVSPHNDGRRVFVYLALAGAVALVLWTVVKTEMRVRELASQGFTDVVIDSTRNHAYAPLIGGFIGAAIAVGIGVLIRKAMRK